MLDSVIAAPIRWASAVASPAGGRAKLSTFIFHRVHAQPDPLRDDEPDAQQFDRILAWIGSQFRVLHPLEACERLTARSLPARSAVITFDDGYQDNCDVALPVLRRHGMSAVFFIATGYMQGGAMFNDRVIEAVRSCATPTLDCSWLGLGELPTHDDAARVSAIRRLLNVIKYLAFDGRNEAIARLEAICCSGATFSPMMSPEAIRKLAAAGMEIGGHTRSHPILRVMEPEEAWQEINGGREDLAQVLGRKPELFAYPNGRMGEDFTSDHVTMVERAGFQFAFSTHLGCSTVQTNRFLLQRFTPWDRTRLRFQLHALHNVLTR